MKRTTFTALLIALALIGACAADDAVTTTTADAATTTAAEARLLLRPKRPLPQPHPGATRLSSARPV